MRARLWTLSFALPAAMAAQTPAMGPEFQVSSPTTGFVSYSSVASAADGSFVVVWQSEYNADIRARRYDPNGSPLGGPFAVSTPGGFQPDVAMNGSGEFVVTWASTEIFARRFDSDGNPLGGEFQVNVYTTGYQQHSAVAMDDAANFVVVWWSGPSLSGGGSQDGNGGGVFGRRFDGDGTPLGGDIQLNTYTTGEQNMPDVSMSGDGRFVAVWQSFGQVGADGEIFGQRYDSAGSPQGSEFQINTVTTDDQGWPSVAVAPDGSFVVAWGSYPLGVPQPDSADVFARRFASDSIPLDDGFQVNTYTTNSQGRPHVAVAADGQFMVTWDSYLQDGSMSGAFAQRYAASGRRVGDEFQIAEHTSGYAFPQGVTCDGRGQFIVNWRNNLADGSGPDIFARRFGFPDARPLSVDERASGGTSNVNGVLESGERVAVDPAWKNASTAALPLTGAASNFTGPAGPTYTLDDTATDYGSIGAGATVDCYGATGDCLEVTVSGARPAPHWDATFDEALSSGVTKTWTLHVGESFPDVPTTQTFYAFIENLFHNRITGGCGGGDYCPDNPVTRGQMAVFLLKAEHGAEYAPPDCAGIFPDVPCPSPFADWIEQLAAEGITGGCGGGNYCPDNPVTRAQMAVFLLKAEHGSAYAPPPCAGIFPDVPCSSPFADWIEQLFAEQITGGCGGGNYCPGNPNTRGQMAVFLVKTFGLPLYGAD